MGRFGSKEVKTRGQTLKGMWDLTRATEVGENGPVKKWVSGWQFVGWLEASLI